MGRMNAMLAATAFLACGPVSASEPPPAPCAPAGFHAGFFAIPAHPVSYSFADICNLGIEPHPQPAAAAGPLGHANLPANWAAADKPASPPPAASAPPSAGPALSFASVPEPSDWMRLSGIVVVAMIAKRRRAWSALRGLALEQALPIRPRHPRG